MSLDAVKTQEGERPDLVALEANPVLGYIGNLIYPQFKIGAKAGTYYYATLEADYAAQTNRSAGAAPTTVTLAESSSTFSAGERILRYEVPYEMVPLIGGVAGSDKLGAMAAKRSVQNSLETAQLTALFSGAGTSITSAIIDGLIDAGDKLHRYSGQTAFVCNVGIYRWLIQQTEIQNLLVRTFGGAQASDILSLTPTVFQNMMQAIFGVDRVLIADDLRVPYARRATAAMIKMPPAGIDDMTFVMEPQLGRTMTYWPTDGSPYEVSSYADDDDRANKYTAVVWDSIEQMNSGAKVLLELSTSGSTTT